MKIAIHERNGSYSDRWIEYCKENKINYKIVNCLHTDIIRKVRDCDILLWHWSHLENASKLVAEKIIKSIETMGILVYPNSDTCWYYDDKVAQKYLLEAIDAPHPKSYVLYDHDDALKFIDNIQYPIVFKLKSGAGAGSVQLIENKKKANKIVKRAFSSGFNSVPGYFSDIATKYEKTKKNKNIYIKMKRLPEVRKNLIYTKKMHGKQIGYVLLQEYQPDNIYDTRINIIGGRAFGSIRFTRKGDFRASGSGSHTADPDKIDLKMIKIAFDVSKILKSQSLAYDFVYDINKKPKIVEISYAFPTYSVRQCPGYWDKDLKWYSGSVWPEDCIIEDIINRKKLNE